MTDPIYPYERPLPSRAAPISIGDVTSQIPDPLPIVKLSPRMHRVITREGKDAVIVPIHWTDVEVEEYLNTIEEDV